MTREEAKELLPIMQAFAEGKTIQLLDGGKWLDVYETDFHESPVKYRIKPEPRYRPFKTRGECWDEMMKHQPFGWIKLKENKEEIVHIARIFEVPNNLLITLSIDEVRNVTSGYLLSAYTFADGAPFGIKEE